MGGIYGTHGGLRNKYQILGVNRSVTLKMIRRKGEGAKWILLDLNGVQRRNFANIIVIHFRGCHILTTEASEGKHAS
jgi:hypothetical protein